jgi:PKD repeat protein
MRRFFLFWLVALLFWSACSKEIERPTAVIMGPAQEVAVSELVTLDGSRSNDADGRALTYSWTFASTPAGSKAELGAANTANAYFTADVTGDFLVQLIVSNGVSASLPEHFTVHAGKCGTNLPVIASIDVSPAMGVNQNDVVSLSATVTDADIDTCMLKRTLSYAWRIAAAPGGSMAAVLGADTKTPSFRPDLNGTYTIELTVTDDLGRSASKTQDITVGNCGSQAPTVSMVTPNPMAPNVGDKVQLSATPADADTVMPCTGTETYAYAWQFVAIPKGSNATFNLASAANPTFVPDLQGTYTVGVTVTDTAGHQSKLATADVTVAACGKPVIGTFALTQNGMALPMAGANANQPVQLSAPVTETPACNMTQTYTYNWSIINAPAGSKATLSSSTAQNPTLTPDKAGSYVVQLIVTDADSKVSDAKTVTVPVNGACGTQPPTIALQEVLPQVTAPSAGPVTGSPAGLNEVVQLNAGASSSPDNLAPCNAGKTLAFKWAFIELPSGSKATVNGANVANPSFTTDTAGKYVVQLTVTDSTNLSTSTTFSIIADPAVNIAVPAGFTVTSLAAGVAQGFDTPRGVTEETNAACLAANNCPVYVISAGNSRIRKIAAGAVTNFFVGGNCGGSACRDLVFDATGGQFFATTNGGLFRITTAGAPTNCVVGDMFGVDMYTTSTNLLRVMVANRTPAPRRVEFYDPANCGTLLVRNDFNNNQGSGSGLGNIGVHQGVAGAVIAGVDTLFEADRERNQIRRNINGALADNTGTNAVLSGVGSGVTTVDEPRDIILTPASCATRKLISADAAGGFLLIYGTTPPAASTVIASGFSSPWGLYFENANNLIVTDENLDAVMRITGNFCSL